MANYQRGLDFPNEGFVQRAIEKYFGNNGYQIIEEGYSDLEPDWGNWFKEWMILINITQ